MSKLCIEEMLGCCRVFAVTKFGPVSVLAGQTRYQTVDMCDSMEEAKNKWPEANVLNPVRAHAAPADVPPEDFDPADAGERWTE